MGNRIATIVSVLAVVFMCAVIFTLSAQPADDSTELSMGIVWHIIGFIVPGYDQMSPAGQLYWQQLLDHPVRKTAHFLEYAVLGALMMNMVWHLARESGKRASDGNAANTSSIVKLGVIAWILATAYAVTDEIHQLFVPGRAFMFSDIVRDSAGALAGVFVFALALMAIKRHRKAKSGGESVV